jgi:hypothetical protein
MTNRPRDAIERELAEARGDLSRLQSRSDSSSADARAALQRVLALQDELDAFGGQQSEDDPRR